MAALIDEADRWLTACFRGGMAAIRHIVSEASEVVADSCRAITACMMFSIARCGRSGIYVDGVDMTDVTNLKKFLREASADCELDTVLLLIKLPMCPVAVKIESLELLGASYVDDEDLEDINIAVYCWSKSLKERGKAKPADDVSPKSDETHPVFGVVEFSTDQDLKRVRLSVDAMRMQSVDAMRMQSLVVRERIFGAQHSHTSKHVLNRAIISLNQLDIDKSVTLLTYIADIQYNHGCNNWTLEEFEQLVDSLSEVIYEDSPVKYKALKLCVDVLTKMVNVVEHEMKPQMDPKQPWNCTDDDLHLVLRSLRIVMQSQRVLTTVSEEYLLELGRVVEKIVRLNVRDRDGYTPLHLACRQLCHASLYVVKMLLEAGAEAGAVHGPSGDTPLHCLAISRCSEQHQMIQLLLDSGAHYDAGNADGKCFTDLFDSENQFTVENPLDYTSLQCLSAKVVKRSGIEFESKVPSRFSEFIKMH